LDPLNHSKGIWCVYWQVYSCRWLKSKSYVSQTTFSSLEKRRVYQKNLTALRSLKFEILKLSFYLSRAILRLFNYMNRFSIVLYTINPNPALLRNDFWMNSLSKASFKSVLLKKFSWQINFRKCSIRLSLFTTNTVHSFFISEKFN
jgi:hypothetical protein